MTTFWRLSKSNRDNAPGFFVYILSQQYSQQCLKVRKNEMSNIYSFSENIIEFKRNLTSLKAATFQDLCLFLYFGLKILINWRVSHQIIVTRVRPLFVMEHDSHQRCKQWNKYWSKALEATRVTSTCRLKTVTFVRSKAMLEFWI